MTTTAAPPVLGVVPGGSAPDCPYVGLAPFDEEESAFFFGRERETEIIVANLQASRLTLLYAQSGVGKSSVLRAGVIPRLRQQTEDDEDDDLDFGPTASAVAYVSDWSTNPLEAIASSIQLALDRATGRPESLRTGSPSRMGVIWLRQLLDTAGFATLYLVLDQFEEFFFYHPADAGAEGLTITLGEILSAPDLDVHVLLSVREDALAGLDRFKGRVPHLFDNYLRLAHLTQTAARSAIVGPLREYNRRVGHQDAMAVDPALVDDLLDQVRTGNVVIGREDGPADAISSENRGDIETPTSSSS